MLSVLTVTEVLAPSLISLFIATTYHNEVGVLMVNDLVCVVVLEGLLLLYTVNLKSTDPPHEL